MCDSFHLLECKLGRLVSDNMVFFNAKMGISVRRCLTELKMSLRQDILERGSGECDKELIKNRWRWDWLFAPCKIFPYFSLSPVSSLVITLGTGIWAIGDLFRNCQWPCSLARSSGCSLCCGGHLACRSRTDVYHSSLILTSSSPCAVCWSTFPLYMMLQAASVRWG